MRLDTSDSASFPEKYEAYRSDDDGIHPKFSKLLQRTNCTHFGFFQPDTQTSTDIAAEMNQFSLQEIAARYTFAQRSVSECEEQHLYKNIQEVIRNTLPKADYVSLIWSRTRQALVGMGEIYPGQEPDEHEISFMWHEAFTKSTAGLAHFVRRGLVCAELRHLLSYAQQELQAKSIIASVEETNQRARNVLERPDIGFYPFVQKREIVYKKSFEEKGPTSALHEFFLDEYGD